MYITQQSQAAAAGPPEGRKHTGVEKKYIARKGMNPALMQMSEQQKAKSHIDAATRSHKLITDKVLHDEFGFGPVRRERFRIEYQKQLDLYERGYWTYEEMLELAKNDWRE